MAQPENINNPFRSSVGLESDIQENYLRAQCQIQYNNFKTTINKEAKRNKGHKKNVLDVCHILNEKMDINRCKLLDSVQYTYPIKHVNQTVLNI
jgi:hypothetical protein